MGRQHRGRINSDHGPPLTNMLSGNIYWVHATRLVAFILAQASAAGAQRAPTAPTAIPLVGDWQLDLARTHYGPGVDRRRSER